MALLKDSLVQGSLRVTDELYNDGVSGSASYCVADRNSRPCAGKRDPGHGHSGDKDRPDRK